MVEEGVLDPPLVRTKCQSTPEARLSLSVLCGARARATCQTRLVAVASGQRGVCHQGGPAAAGLERFPARVERVQADDLVQGEGERGRVAARHDHQLAAQGLMPRVLQGGGEGEAGGAVVQGFHSVLPLKEPATRDRPCGWQGGRARARFFCT